MYRKSKLEHVLHRAIADYISRFLTIKNKKGEEILVTVSLIELSKDERSAKIFYVLYPDNPENEKAAQRTLDSARGDVRNYVGKKLKSKYTPEIAFIFDKGIYNVYKVEELLENRNRHLTN